MGMEQAERQTDGRTDRRTDGRIAPLLNAPYRNDGRFYGLQGRPPLLILAQFFRRANSMSSLIASAAAVATTVPAELLRCTSRSL